MDPSGNQWAPLWNQGRFGTLAPFQRAPLTLPSRSQPAFLFRLNSESILHKVFSIKLLGGAALEGQAGPVTGRAAHKRRIALLALLALARGRSVPRERIIGLLWPEHPSDAARHLLSESLYVLRKEIGDGVFVSRGDEIGLNLQAVACDVVQFEEAIESEALTAAAQLYRGAFLDGFYLAEAPEFERWAEDERDRLARAYGRLLEALATELEGQGRCLEAVEWLRRLAIHDRFSSRVAVRLIRALDASGDRAAALRFAASHFELLRQELEVEPGDELRRVVEELRTPARRVADLRQIASSSEGTGGEPHDTAAEAASAHPLTQVPTETTGGFLSHVENPTEPNIPKQPDVVPARSRQRPRWNQSTYRAGTLGMILGLLIAALTGGNPRGDQSARAPGLDPRRIAVLPFETSAEPELQALSTALTGAMIDRLSEVRALRVISRGGVSPYTGEQVYLDSITQRLRVGTVVTARLQRSQGVYRVAVQLIDGNTGEQLGSRQVEVRETELFALEDAVADEVERFLRQRLGDFVRLREHRAATRSVEAYSFVLRAERLRSEAGEVAQSRDPMDINAASALLRSADSLLIGARLEDREWIQPAVDRAWVWLDLSVLTSGPGRVQALHRALAHADTALEIDADNASALEARGTARWRLATAMSGPGDTLLASAERDLRAATMRVPGLASAWSSLSQVLRFKGALAESRQTARRALEEDAYLEDADNILNRLFHISVMLRDYDGALSWCERGRREFPGDWRFVECQLTLMREDQQSPANARHAWALVSELEKLDPPEKARRAGNPYSPIFRRMVAAAISARAGDESRARAEIARARRETAGSRELAIDLKYDEAYVRLVLGERSAAINLLREYVQARPELREFLLRDPLFVQLAEEL